MARTKKEGFHKRIISYRGHVIWYDTYTGSYMVAIKRDGTDTYFATMDDAFEAIDALEDDK